MNVSVFLEAAREIFTLYGIAWVGIGVLAGILLGAMPGISTNMAISLLFSLCYTIDGTAGVSMLLGIYCGGIYGGSISAILLNTPGTPANAATMLDGYPMAKRGEPGRALGISTMSSGFGGLFSAVCLMLFSTLLARISLKFTSLEYCAFAVFGISIISSIASKSVIKGLMGGVIGLLASCIGVDSLTGTLRYTFGTTYLMGGLPLIPLLIGLFALSQALVSVEELVKNSSNENEGAEYNFVKGGGKKQRFLPTRKDIKACIPTLLRSSIIGTVIGAVPGTGGDISSFVCYNEAKRWSKDKEKFGTGCPEGIAAPEAGNNSVSGGAMIPVLSLGIPGDSCTAMLLGALMIKGISPGPTLFTSDLVYAYEIFISMFIANGLMIVFGFLLLRYVIRIVMIKSKHLIPIIVVLCFVGTYSFNRNYGDLVVMVAAGIIGYFASKHHISLSAFVIGYILGTMAESNFRRFIYIEEGNILAVFHRPIAVALFAIALVTLLSPMLKRVFFWIREGRFSRR
ncbi:MAG: C4-dicarboxylate ABC transporter permease [Dorea sp.]|nr:C4-dicarboxylate ABC transporter permease [Dorea sp.]